MPKPGLIEIVFILDCSVSMQPLRSTVIDSFNEFLDKQQELSGEALFTLAHFNSTYRLVHDGIDLPLAQPMRHEDYINDYGTALNDAIGFTAQAVTLRHQAMPEEERPERVLVAIFTDGLENDSRVWNNQTVYDLIAQKTETEGWEFFYVGCGSEAYVGSSQIGISPENSFSYDPGPGGTHSGFNSISGFMTSRRTGPNPDNASLKDQIDKVNKKKRILH